MPAAQYKICRRPVFYWRLHSSFNARRALYALPPPFSPRRILEKYLCREVASAAAAFEMRGSAWNGCIGSRRAAFEVWQQAIIKTKLASVETTSVHVLFSAAGCSSCPPTNEEDIDLPDEVRVRPHLAKFEATKSGSSRLADGLVVPCRNVEGVFIIPLFR